MPRRTKVALVDTNVVLRFLLADDPLHFPRAAALWERVDKDLERVAIGEGVLVECVWVLLKVKGVPRVEVARHLSQILAFDGVRVTGSKRVLLDALALFARTSTDIVDCLLAARARAARSTVYTFDETDFRRLNCDWKAPQ